MELKNASQGSPERRCSSESKGEASPRPCLCGCNPTDCQPLAMQGEQTKFLPCNGRRIEISN